MILVILITVMRLFLTNPETKRFRKCCAMNIQFGRNKKKKTNLRGKGGWKINNENKSLWLIFLKYIFEFMINTAPPASNSVHQQKLTEKDFKYNNFLILTLSWAAWRSGLGADLPMVRIRHSTQLQ